MKNKVISIVVVLIFICANCCFSIADQSSTYYSNKANEAKNNSEKAHEELNEVSKELDSALQEVSEITDSIDNVETEIDTLAEKIEGLNVSISEKEADLKEKETLLDERLTVTYMNEGTNPYMEALFSGGIVNFVSNYDMIKQIAEYDTNLINEVKEVKSTLESEKQEAEDSKIEKEKKNEELKSLKSKKQEKVNSLTDEQKEIQAKADEYDSQMKLMQKKEKEAVAAEKAAVEAAKKAAAAKTTNSSSNSSSGSSSSSSSSSTSSVSSSGKFLWPVPSSSYVSSNWGYRIHPIYGTKKLHAGMDIAASTGANIVAAESGTVILSSWGYNGGYGNYIIISHGNGYTTRYAHCSNLYVKVGDTVSRGQVIAAVGSTGASTGPHCHFEVRINGESKNPVNYL
ncbi:MAG: peptidoglycan DD-metalloendopeptidase family protein [Clostridia bacterium]|nr:peptidoglycan DD-metalloendopeptidase family protein [Clostridia bacterium]